MESVLRWAALITGIALVLFCLSDIVHFSIVMHDHGLRWSWAFIADNPIMPERWAMWLFVAVVLIGNARYSFRNERHISKDQK